MVYSLLKQSINSISRSRSNSSMLTSLLVLRNYSCGCTFATLKKRNIKEEEEVAKAADESDQHHHHHHDDAVPTFGICCPLFDILKELNKKVHDSLVKIYGTDAEIFCESTGTALTSEVGYGDPVHKAEAMAFRRACACFRLGLHLYHEDML